MGFKDWYMYALGALIFGAFFVVLWLLIFNPIPEVNKDVLNIALGALVAKFSDVVAYFYGSSKGSSDKTEMLKKNGS